MTSNTVALEIGCEFQLFPFFFWRHSCLTHVLEGVVIIVVVVVVVVAIIVTIAIVVIVVVVVVVVGVENLGSPK